MSDPIDGGQIVLDFADDELGDLSAADLAHRYLWGTKVDELLADERVDATPGTSDDVGWVFTDHQGSVRAVARYDSAADATTVTKQIVYDAFGNVASTSGSDATTPLFLYTGRLYDSATQLQNNLNRWYDATTGRWLSTDPIGFAGDPGNLYCYCGNGPGNWIDPTGEGLVAWIFTGYWSPPPEVYDAAVEAAGDYYLDNAGQAHEALEEIGHVDRTGLTFVVRKSLTILEGDQLHEAVMNRAPGAQQGGGAAAAPPILMGPGGNGNGGFPGGGGLPGNPPAAQPPQNWGQETIQWIHDYGER